MSIINDFNTIFAFCFHYNSLKKAINASEDQSQTMKAAQKRILIYLQALLEYNGLAEYYELKNSSGMPSMPRVPWISVIRKNQKVYSHPSVTICFGRAGNGFVVGLMKSVSTNKFELETIERVSHKKFIDINSSKASTSYNNKFVNPTEFYKDEINLIELEKKIIESLSLEQNFCGDLIL